MIDIQTFHSCLAQTTARGYDLDDNQKKAVEYGDGQLWLLAGPGSGKSEVLVTRTLKLLCVDNIEPKSIFLTTFTEKAARNLEDRLATYLAVLQNTDSDIKDVDIADIRIGTLHSLCNDILQEYRYPNYQNVRLLDKVEQDLFTYRYSDISKHEDLDFWIHFDYVVKTWKKPKNQKPKYPPNKWQRAKAGVTLFNHIVEDYLDIDRMLNAGEHWETLAELYQQYSQALKDNYRCDFAHLQAYFLEFLKSPASRQFLEGDYQNPPLKYILVDEYQDTNPIQERIYLALAHQKPHNITVVGDDDQALYRFRGGNVTCMVNFDKACQEIFNQTPHQLQLENNYRSHPDIVNFFNHYITSFAEMNVSGVRAPNKQPIIAASSISGNYPAVSWIQTKNVGDLANSVAQFIHNHLISDGIIKDLSQCVLLLRSAKDSPRNAGPFIQAFQNLGIPIYNPRSKSFMDSGEVKCLLAALIQVIDKNHSFQSKKDPKGKPLSWVTPIQEWFATLDHIRNDSNISTNSLDDYLKKSNTKLSEVCKNSSSQDNPGRFLKLNLLEIIYRILAQEPFLTWRQDPVRNLRLSKVTRLFEGYNSFNLDSLRANYTGTEIDSSFLNRFYNMFVSYLIEAGIDEDEDDEVIVPEGSLPIMTIHQSKGLEFPFVFVVTKLGREGQVGAAQQLEQTLAPFRQNLYPRVTRTPEDLAIEDDIRLLYVAYSRAQYGLILIGTKTQIKSHIAVPNRDHLEFQRNTDALII
ncbi:ATP-dependent helicase [Crocosphaera sp.]|uniref:ATP-dependent helicase n=1 Tax=Crocosphaera sp. TaxID=2729996 RepID=UPI002609EED1|nr:ATP-dependent helicase [Crocosphaera sp.]MDJ0578633.1 ATP-dependent helicase [Crocosphaera sp.]